MTNIWELLMQSIAISLVAVFLMIIKHFLNQHLSPKWQCGIWALLGFRIILPVNLNGNLFGLSISSLIEYFKYTVEINLNSTFSAPYIPLENFAPIPILNSSPTSITDWIFVVYVIGVFGFLIHYLTSYFRLRLIINKSEKIGEGLENQINNLCNRYNLTACEAVTVVGLDTAFVCGIIKPVLVLPKNVKIDDKVILHEFLHVKYNDSFQNTVWCIFKALHWCNPFLHFVFDRIANDLESLCDTRILERLEGEERREYGIILLEMTNDKYSVVFGTTNVSNGGKNIAKRIEAIVRFKKYPQGMEVLSICTVIILAIPTLATEKPNLTDTYLHPSSETEYNYSMAGTRLNRCTTIAGAIDTYAKGILLENVVYFATASPLSMQADFEENREENFQKDVYYPWYHHDIGEELYYLVASSGYNVFNISESSENTYSATLVFEISGFLDENGHKTEGFKVGYVSLNVEISLENGFWVVEEFGERKVYINQHIYEVYVSTDLGISPKIYSAKGEFGTMTVALNTEYKIENITNGQANMFDFFTSTNFDTRMKTDAKFSGQNMIHNSKIYKFEGSEELKSTIKHVGMRVYAIGENENLDDIVNENIGIPSGSTSSSSSDGWSYTTLEVDENWDGEIFSGGGYGAELDDNNILITPEKDVVLVYFNGELVEKLSLQEVDR